MHLTTHPDLDHTALDRATLDEVLRDAYSEWAGEWSHALRLGGVGDLEALRCALNAATENLKIKFVGKPKAKRSTSVASKNDLTCFSKPSSV